MCLNIKWTRAVVSLEVINSHFDELEKQLARVPSSDILNYDKTNMMRWSSTMVDPERQKIIARRECMYSERVMNSSKSSIITQLYSLVQGLGSYYLLTWYIKFRTCISELDRRRSQWIQIEQYKVWVVRLILFWGLG